MSNKQLSRFIFILIMVLSAPVDTLSAKSNPGFSKNILVEGHGERAVRHSKVIVHYTGWLKNGKKFDSSVDRGKPFEFTLGVGQVIPGWDRGVENMKVGGKRELIIPPELAYGKRGAGAVIPANATLKFEITLLAVTSPKYSNVNNVTLKSLLSKGTKIIDIRRKEEWDKTGVIKGSHKLTAFDNAGKFVRSFPAGLKSFASENEAVILICRSGNRSSTIANLLVERAGYEKVYNVAEGIVRWIKDGNSVIR